ncbi:3-phosphoinositide-dependent protein [Musa troglodytarum]|uniref:3-phosphoinositide-dependent protein n=1 Tax=Musa troglodytarum TaxID=320322 RepID=A0A9E7FW13_9LILI|nr:3-phosphoinositide-dependent protein [Musa troglodytarum]
MALLSVSAIWNEIDLCESYLVCCMFKEAASLASSTVHRVRSTPFADAVDDVQMAEMMESAGMVFVQSMKELGRTQELFVELRELFGSVETIPVQVFLTGACMQISERFTSNLRAIFEEFLSKWKYVDGGIYVLTVAEPESSSDKVGMKQSVMGVKNYLEVAEVYTITVLGMVLCSLDLAISWTEKAELPEESRQVLLRRLHSLLSAKNSSSHSNLGGGLQRQQAQSLSSSTGGSTSGGNEAYPEAMKQELHSGAGRSRGGLFKTGRPSIRNILEQISCYFWWFRTIHLKFGNVHLVLPSGKQMLVCSLIVLTYYVLRQKGTILKRSVATQAAAIKRAMIDAWQLAFSVQVNPLAAIQQLPSSPHGSMQ